MRLQLVQACKNPSLHITFFKIKKYISQLFIICHNTRNLQIVPIITNAIKILNILLLNDIFLLLLHIAVLNKFIIYIYEFQQF